MSDSAQAVSPPVAEALPEPGSLPGPTGLQIWWTRLQPGELSADLRAELAADVDAARLAKLDRFVRTADRDRGLAAHALLRRLLAGLIGGRPADVVLRTQCASCGTDEHGKPYLDAGSAEPPVQLNLSHSGPVVCVALAPPGVQVGVDVEERRAVDWTALRRSVFADAEWEAAERAPEPARHRTDAWARKEAAVKASGHGLSLPFREVIVEDVVPGGWTATLPEGAGTATGWDLGLLDTVAAAVAVSNPPSAPARPEIHLVTLG